jgi:putative endonuclease
LSIRASGVLADCAFYGSSLGQALAAASTMLAVKRFVYVLRSLSGPIRYYTGITSDITSGLEAHNTGRCSHTASGRPWAVDVVVEFSDERRAAAFERYLKSGSGVSFAKRHFR